MIVLALAAALIAPQPGKLHTYKDWIVGCDNVRTCQANALVPEDADDADTYLRVLVSRDAGPRARAVLTVPLPDKTAIGTRFALTIDGKPAGAITAQADDIAKVPLTRALIDALAGGTKIALLDAQGKSVGRASLAGLVACLIAIDDQQHRVGTSGAIKALGVKPDSAAAPAAPLIVVPARSNRPPRTISVAQAIQLIGPDNARCDYATGKVAPEASRLDEGHSVVVIDHPCGNGAYNLFSSVYVVDETGTPHPALFDDNPGMGDAEDTDLTNGGWDAKTQRMSSYAKGRGIGDCGTSQTYAWDGTRFRMTEMTEMTECRGSVDYIRTWTARTSR